VHNFSCRFISILYLFWATMWEITLSMLHLVCVTVCGWPSGVQDAGIMHTRRSSTQSGKFQASPWYSNFSWWWAHSCPKDVENINKYTRKIVRHVGFICKIIQGRRSTKHKITSAPCSIRQECTNFPKSTNHLKFLGARRVT